MSPSVRLPVNPWTLVRVLLGIIYVGATAWLGYVWSDVRTITREVSTLDKRIAVMEQAAAGQREWLKSISERVRALEQRR